ncbi:MAG: hypothetical protein WBF99_04200 [Xanthobacteraceae bacterium]
MNYHNGKFEDDALDDNGVLRDGQTLRVPLFMIDGTDVKILPVAQDDAQSLAQAYTDAEARLTSAWRDPSSSFPQVTADQKPTKDAATEPATLADAYAAYHERLTTAYLNPPPMVPIIPSNNAESLLPPPSASMTDERAKLYAKHNERLERMWENPL